MDFEELVLHVRRSVVAMVEGAPKTIKEGVTKQEADEIKKKVEAAGAKVEIK